MSVSRRCRAVDRIARWHPVASSTWPRLMALLKKATRQEPRAPRASTTWRTRRPTRTSDRCPARGVANAIAGAWSELPHPHLRRNQPGKVPRLGANRSHIGPLPTIAAMVGLPTVTSCSRVEVGRLDRTLLFVSRTAARVISPSADASALNPSAATTSPAAMIGGRSSGHGPAFPTGHT